MGTEIIVNRKKKVIGDFDSVGTASPAQRAKGKSFLSNAVRKSEKPQLGLSATRKDSARSSTQNKNKVLSDRQDVTSNMSRKNRYPGVNQEMEAALVGNQFERLMIREGIDPYATIE